MALKTAVIFKTHFWDPTADAAYRVCKHFSGHSDVYIMYDTTNKNCDIPDDIRKSENVVEAPFKAMEDIGFEWGNGEEGWGGYWYNGDYHQSLFVLDNPQYDYICSVESDVLIKNDLDKIFEDMNIRGIDAVYKKEIDISKWWPFITNCEGYYDLSGGINRGLFCISFFSRKAAIFLAIQRIKMSVKKRREGLSRWPIGEAFMAQELFLEGLKTEDISYYCDHMDYYDFAPPFLIKEIGDVSGNTFFHPVTEKNSKFIISNIERDYKSLVEENNITSGKSIERAKKINDLEVYSRIYYNDTYRLSDEIKALLADTAQGSLPGIQASIVAGDHQLIVEDLIAQNETDFRTAECVLGRIPSYDRHVAICIHEGEPVSFPLPDWHARLFLSARDQSLPTQLKVVCEKQSGEKEEVSVSICDTVGELSFFTASLPEEAKFVSIHPVENHKVWVNFIKISAQ